jgi:hypothetical protein
MGDNYYNVLSTCQKAISEFSLFLVYFSTKENNFYMKNNPAKRELL